MTVFLDTDVLVDCLRGTAAARDWLRRAASELFQVPGIVAMELLAAHRLTSGLSIPDSLVAAMALTRS